MIQKTKLQDTNLLNGIFKERELLNRNYLLELDSQCLLQNFYLEAGIIMPGLQVINSPENVKLHWGWEAPTCQLRGHFLGHYLSACSYLIALYNDKELLAKVDHIVDELERCQKLNGGKWIGPIPEKYFYRLETNEYIWSPQYTIHKLILGLIHTFEYAKNEKALHLIDNLADWFVEWVNYEKNNHPEAILKGEAGGMLEIWARLYEITKNQKYMDLACAYKENSIFDELQEDKDALSNIHTNASIPLAHGACKMYQITKDEKYLDIALKFWKCAVTDRGYYSTGGQNTGEFWIPPKKFSNFLSDRNQEFCTVYNMVRLADYLYLFTGKSEFAEYIELCLYNGFLTQQNKDTGMPTYFLSLKSGSKKLWGTKTRDFWCCHGTMIQAQTLYSSLCYYQKEENALIINQYIPSVFATSDKSFTLSQTVNMSFNGNDSFFTQNEQGEMSRWNLKFEINSTCTEEYTLSFRVPLWCKSKPTLLLNDTQINYEITDGYIILKRKWNHETISLNFEPKLRAVEMPSDSSLISIMEGPIVLAGLVDSDCGLNIIEDNIDKTFLKQIEHLYTAFPWKQSTYITKRQDKNFSFIPLYEVTNEEYTIYFTKK
jgi:uncharacterized protein